MTQQELQEVLTPREYAVFASIKEGKGLKEIALEQGISLNAVYIARTKVKRKIGKSNFGKVLFAKSIPGASLSQITLKDIKEILSPLEFDFFIFFKTGKLTYRQIAKLLDQKFSSGTILLRIKNKLGGYYQMLTEPEFKIEGLEIKQRPTVKCQGVKTGKCKISQPKRQYDTYRCHWSNWNKLPM